MLNGSIKISDIFWSDVMSDRIGHFLHCAVVKLLTESIFDNECNHLAAKRFNKIGSFQINGQKLVRVIQLLREQCASAQYRRPHDHRKTFAKYKSTHSQN